MIHQGAYDKIDLYSATKGMNQNIAPLVLKPEYSGYIENIMPTSLGEGTLRFGTYEFSDAPQDNIVDGFPFFSENGSKQIILYMNGFQILVSPSNLRITSSNHITLTSANYLLFKRDTLLKLRYSDLNGLSPISTYEIKNVTVTGVNTIDIEVDQNSFADSLIDFYVDAPGTPNPVYIANNQFSITVPADLITNLYYVNGGKLNLKINDVDHILTIQNVNRVDNDITFTTVETTIPNFNGGDTRQLTYKSSTPELKEVYNSYGYIKILDVATNAILAGGDQTLSNLSVACVPRGEFFAKMLWICNGVDPIMTWDGEELKIYEEQIKDNVGSFNRIGDKSFSFVAGLDFDESKYQIGQKIRLAVLNVGDVTTTITNYTKVDTLVTLVVVDDIPNFTGQNRVEVFYFDKPPPFSLMKSAHDRLWCLGSGAVSLEYRVPDLAMRFFYSYTPYSDGTAFRFFNEKTKTVPSEDISAKHGVADNLEAIVNISGNLAFIGRQKTQIWKGIDPLTKEAADYFSWSSTIEVGIYHGNLTIELPNDVYFLTSNGFVSFGTLNIAKQFAASNTENMDKLAMEYISSIDSNIKYRSCRSFKYKSGSFCGFKIGQNNSIVSKYNTSLFWWAVFSGDFANSTSFLSLADDSLYLFIGKKIYQYADGLGNTPILYGDENGTRFIDFVETKYVNNIKNRYANKRYEIDCDYSSNIIINPDNVVKIYISGDLRDTFILEDTYQLPLKGDLLGTINLVDGSKSGNNPNNPSSESLGLRLDSPSHTLKGRLKFLSNNFSVTIVGKLKDGPFNLKRIRLYGFAER
jgi:hypothetical protein